MKKMFALLLISFSIIFIKTKKIESIFSTRKYPFVNTLLEKQNDDDEIAKYERINPDDPDYFYIPVFGTSDIHGHFYPDEFEIGEYKYTQGGLDYLAKYINILRDEFKNQFLYLEGGDLFQGGTESTMSNGNIILEYLKLISANGSTFGNHEFDYTRQFIEEKVANASFPFIAANIYNTKKKTKKALGENHFTSYIFNFTDQNANKSENDEGVEIKIGVIGLALNNTKEKISGKGFEDLNFLDYKDELLSEAKLLRKQNVKAIILLSHLGINCGDQNNMTLNMYKAGDDQEDCNPESHLTELINDIEDGVIDAVVTGHSHREVHHFIRGIPIISPINNGLYANVIYLAFNRKNDYKIERDKLRIEGPLPICEKIFEKNTKCEYLKQSQISEYLPLKEYKFHGVKVEKDPLLQPIHDKYDEEYSKYNEKICTVIGTEDILSVSNNGSFYLGNIISDIQKVTTGADISLVSFGNLRTSWNPGKIPRFKVQDLLPFGNDICSYKMTGREVKKAMETLQIGSKKKYYITSGLKQIMAKNKDGKYYLADVKLFDGYKESELIPDKDYLVTSNYYFVNGGDDFKDVRKWYTPRELNCNYGRDITVTETYLRKQQIIDVRKYMDLNNPRIRFIDQ